MSSVSSPAIEFDCRPPRAVRAALMLAICAAAVMPLLIDRNPLVWMPVLAAVALALTVCVRSGWLGGPRMLRSATWSADGTWWLIDGRGDVFQAGLLADSRVFAHWLWLRWDSPAGRRQAFLARRSLQSETIRRLGVRLRLQGLAIPDPADSLL